MACGCLGLGLVHKLTPDNGDVDWQLALPKGARASSPAIDTNGTIYIGSVTGLLNALTSNGAPKWSVKVGGKNEFSSPVIGDDGTIYLGTFTGLAAVRPLDGQALPNWPFKTEGRVASSAALGADGTIYVGTTKGVFYAINPNGTQKWKQQGVFEGPIYVSPAVGSNGIIYTAAKTTVYALDPADGSIVWQFKTNKPIKWSSPAIGENNTLYIGSGDHNLYALIEIED
jgi:outer membrane protein assembly factor BamB